MLKIVGGLVALSRGTMRGGRPYAPVSRSEAMMRVGLDAIGSVMPVSALGIGPQQVVELARNLIGETRVLLSTNRLQC